MSGSSHWEDMERDKFEDTLSEPEELAFDRVEKRYVYDSVECRWQGWLSKAHSQSDAAVKQPVKGKIE